jgi:hypothetical protein
MLIVYDGYVKMTGLVGLSGHIRRPGWMRGARRKFGNVGVGPGGKQWF